MSTAERLSALDPKLRGKVALVTGSARGLGRAYALRLARLGADVVICDLHLDAADEFDEELFADTVMDECRSYGVRSLGLEFDATDQAAVNQAVAEAVAELGAVDILVNNAGGMLRPVERSFAKDMPADDLQFILDVNLMSTIYCSQAVIPSMEQRAWGRIVNIASQAAIAGGANGFVSYGIAKAGVVRYTRSLAAEVGPLGIHVNCLAPALIRSSRATAQFPEREQRAANIPLRRLGDPEDAAKVVEFFCTDLSDYITGQVLGVCGGVLLSPY